MTVKKEYREVCEYCGKDIEECCVHNFVLVPVDCKCYSPEWISKNGHIGEICSKFVGDHTRPCESCEHDFACHAEARINGE